MDNSICDRTREPCESCQLDDDVELEDELEPLPEEEPEPLDEDVLAAGFESPPDDEPFEPDEAGAGDDAGGVDELVEDRLSLR